MASDKCLSVHDLHLQHGPVVRIGLNELSFSNAVTANQIYGHDPRLVKAPVYNALGNGVVPSLFDGIIPSVHRERRRILAPIFAKTNVEKEEARVVIALGHFVDLLRRKRGRSLNMALWCRTLALEISASIFLDEQLGLLASDTPHQYASDLDSAMAMSGVKWYIPWAIPIMKRLPFAALRDFAESPNRLYGFALRGLQSYIDRFGLEGLTESSRAVGKLFQADLNDDELSSELAGMLLAGTEPTGTTMAFALWRLAVHPEWQQALRQELLTTVQEDQHSEVIVPTWNCIKDLKLLNAFITESLRLHPSAPGSLPRLVLEDMEIGGIYVPKGVSQ